MTTVKYELVRRAIYEVDPFRKLKEQDKVKNQLKTLKKQTIALFLLASVASISALILALVDRYRVLGTLLDIFAGAILIRLGNARENFLYNSTKREAALSEKKRDYDECLNIICQILIENDISSYEQVKFLKTECIKRIEYTKKPFSWIQSVLYKGLIAIPFGAYIGFKISTENPAITSTTISIISIGVFFLLFAWLSKGLFFLAKGCYKDVYLLKAIHELEYMDMSLGFHLPPQCTT